MFQLYQLVTEEGKALSNILSQKEAEARHLKLLVENMQVS